MNHYINKQTFIHSKEKISWLLHNKTVRNGGLYSIFSFFNRGVSFLLLMILAKYIGPEEYGELSLYNTIVMFLGYFLGLSTAGYFNVSYFRKSKEEFAKDFTSICVITLSISFLFFLFVTTCSAWLSPLLKIPATFLYIGVLVSFANIFVQINLDYFRIKETLSWYGVFSCGFAFLNFALSLYLVIHEDLNWVGRVYAQLCCDLFFFAIAMFIFTRDGLFSFAKDWDRYKKIILYGLPIIPHQASLWVKSGLDRYIIENAHTMADVGLFSFALNLAGTIGMIGMAFNQTNSVSIYKTLSGNGSEQQKQATLHKKEKIFNVLYIGVAVLVIIFGICFVPIFLPNYSRSIPYFAILAISSLLQCIYFVYCNYLFYYFKTKELMLITFGTSLLHLALSLWLTRYSLYLTCVVYVISQGIVTLCVFLLSKKILRKNLISNQ